jgi:membrane-associated phospholipid phosphatase
MLPDPLEFASHLDRRTYAVWEGQDLKTLRRTPLGIAAVGLAFFFSCVLSSAQTSALSPMVPSTLVLDLSRTSTEPASLDILAGFPPDQPHAPVAQSNDDRRGFVVRNLRRAFEDQKQLYLAPLKPKNLKWDALFLGTTAALLATDRRVMRNIPTDHVNISHDLALLCLGGTGAAVGGLWLHGIRTGNPHAKETGELTLESLANTFLIYTPMQFIAGRERPDEGTGNGRFWRHGNFNTSFPAGHPLFTWAMASVVAHEYPRRWVKILAYGAAVSVSGARLTGRNHFPSDIWVGSTLGYLIGTHIFHAHCDPELSHACHRER